MGATVASADGALKEKEELLQVLESEQTRLTREMDRTMQLYLAGEISKEGFGREYRPREERLKQLQDQIPVLQGEIDFLKIQYLSRDEILSEAKDLASRWSGLTADEKRQVIENITEKITISKDEVTIDLCYLPSSSETMVGRQRGVRGSSPRPA